MSIFNIFNNTPHKLKQAYENRIENIFLTLRELVYFIVESKNTTTLPTLTITIKKEELTLLSQHIGLEEAIKELYYPLLEKQIRNIYYE